MNVAEGQRILKEVQSEFKECVDAGAIAQKARMEKIISEAVEIQIIESKSLDAAKEVLFEHLHNQVTLEGLRSFCSIMIESEGYQLMQKFGKGLLTKLEEVMPRPGSSQVSSAAACDVKMEGGIEQQHTLSRAQRKRPPEDHADHEWKRWKDSDSAGGAARYALGEAWRKRPPEDHAEREWKRQKDSDSAGPMSDYNSSALIAFREKLKTNVAMKPHLTDMLEEQAGGFMTRAEAQSVRKAEDPMGRLIEILLGKGDKEFNTFCDMLERSNHRGWANSLRLGAKPNRQKEGDLEESKTTEHSSAIELSREGQRSSTTSSDDLVLQQSVAKKSLQDYTAIKRDHLVEDISDLHSEADPEVIIKLLYGNALATISDLLEPHLKAVKKVAVRYHRLGVHHVAVGEDIIESADSIDSLMSRMSVGRMWDGTHFLRKAIASIPHSAPERSVAEAILLHYEQHLAIYEWATLLKDALTKESESKEEVEASTEANKLVPLEITSSKAFDSFTCEDCYTRQTLVLSAAYGIPKEKLICHDVEERQTFDGPMAEWHQAALVALQGSLKSNVKMIQLSDMLERPAGGFMDRAEALRVNAKTGDMEQMGELINILLGKEDMAFYTFCDLLQRSNYEVWARELKSAAERLKTVGAPNEGGQTARKISVSKTTAPAEIARQAFAEKLAGLGAVGLPRATVETTSMHSTAKVISVGMASNTEISSEKLFKPGPSSPVAPLCTTRPSLEDLVYYAVPHIAPSWYDVGLQLDLEPDVLDEIEKEKSDQPRKMLAKWLQGSSCTWQSILNAVGEISGEKPMEDIRAAVVESITELSQKHRKSSTQTSEDLELQQYPAPKKSLPDYTTLKMDFLAQDISHLHSKSDPEVIIKLLYVNALATISDLLEPHLKAVQKFAGRYQCLGLHHVAVGEDIIESADSIDSLMSQMSVGGMWGQTRFLRKAIASIPHSAPERGVTEAILLHYDQHLAIYKRATLLKDALTKESESTEEVEASTEANKLVPLEITSPEAFDGFSCEDCYILQVRGLKAAFGIPEEMIISRDVEERLTFESSETPSSAHPPIGPDHGIPNPKRRRPNPTVYQLKNPDIPNPKRRRLFPTAAAVHSPCHPELGMEPVLIDSPDEVLLKELCYMATGIHNIHVGPGGGTFTLGCGDATLNVPPGALIKETSVHFAIILHGPFVFSSGYRPGSVVVYVNMDGAALVKPVCLNLSHWCSREEASGNTLKFIRSPHVPDAQMKYFFEELEEGDFTTHTNVGMLTIPEPQCLYCVEMKNEGVARYNALTFQRNGASASSLFFRIQLMCDSQEWNKTVEGALHKIGWSSCSCGVATFSFAAEESDQKRTITACPVDAKGPGWISTIEGHQLVSEDFFLKMKNKTREEFKGEVSSGRFPPYVHYKLLYTSPQERRTQPSLMMVNLKGTNENLILSFDIMEEAMALSLPSPPQQPPINPRDSGASMPHPPQPLPPPDTADIVKALNNQLDARWRHFGTFLRVDYQTMESIRLDNGGRPDDCMLDLLGKWTSNQKGTGTLPRTWQTVVEAVKETGFGAIAENLAHKHGLTLSQ